LEKESRKEGRKGDFKRREPEKSGDVDAQLGSLKRRKKPKEEGR